MPFRPRKKKNRQAKYHRCSWCGSQVRSDRALQAVLRAAKSQIRPAVAHRRRSLPGQSMSQWLSRAGEYRLGFPFDWTG